MRVNENLTTSGTVRWRNIPNIAEHSRQSMKNKWSSDLRLLYNFNGFKHVLKHPNLFTLTDTPQRKENARKTPQIKSVKISRSFLWGAIKYERYE
jgi:hypothetical protein